MWPPCEQDCLSMETMRAAGRGGGRDRHRVKGLGDHQSFAAGEAIQPETNSP